MVSDLNTPPGEPFVRSIWFEIFCSTGQKASNRNILIEALPVNSDPTAN